ncbi:MAG TPA: hypothetical protein VMF88_06010 [Bacteroidota bacterium]|nr:hypothetical protein [Bacteroidota bacterium]
MGQQQLLLIILGLIIVGVAVVVGIGMFQDNAVDHNRALVIADLKTLASKAQHYYSRPQTMGGGNNSFVGLTADDRGLGLLAGTAFTNNANGTYSIISDGTATQVVLQGVGKVIMTDGTYPTYTMTVLNLAQNLTKIN